MGTTKRPCPFCLKYGWDNPIILESGGEDKGRDTCIFHAADKRFFISDTSFNNIVFEHIINSAKDNTVCNLTGTIFDRDIDFSTVAFLPPIIFNSCHFKGDASFARTTFFKTNATSFNHAIFTGKADFSNTRFEGDTSFEGSIFKNGAIFNESFFSQKATFRYGQFLKHASFKKVEFQGGEETIFQTVIFMDSCTFLWGKFLTPSTDFSHTRFNGDAIFLDTTFDNQTKFNFTKFQGDANFYKSTFSKVEFKGTQFESDANFSRTTHNIAKFNNTKFKGILDFSKAISNSLFAFNNVTAISPVNFSNSHFLSRSHFHDSAFYDQAQFNRAKFSKRVLFLNVIFFKTSSFWNCKFPENNKGNIISFASCRTDNNSKIYIEGANLSLFRTFNVDLSIIAFINCTWPKDNRGFLCVFEETQERTKSKTKQLEQVYRSLKKNALVSRSEFQASDWHYKEKVYAFSNLRMAKKDTKPARYYFFYSFYKLYDWFSGYGERPGKALTCLFILLLLPLLFYISIAVFGTCCTSVLDWKLVGDIFQKWLGFIPLVRTSIKPETLTPLEIVFMAFSQVLITIQATLFALALRNRFRR